MKHAYLIIAHNDFELLEKLIKLLDYEDNDIYIHIDKKVKSFDFEYFKKIVKKSNLYFTRRISVYWGTFSQIESEYILLEEAIKKKYAYYHLLSGVDLPLKSQQEIHSFFDKSKKEFVCFSDFENNKEDILDRIRRYNFFVAKTRNKDIKGRIYSKLWWSLNKLQKRLKIERNINMDIKYGPNWFSITHELATYVVSKKDFVFSNFTYTYCCDEIFLQTLVYNSKFFNNLYSYNDVPHKQNQRYVDWKRGNPYTFKYDDYDELMNSGVCFARKFSTKLDDVIINKIYNKLQKNKII